MRDPLSSDATPPAAAGPVERWCTTAALLLAGAAALIGAVVIGNADERSDPWRAGIVLWGVAPSFVAWAVAHDRRSVAVRVPVLWCATVPAALAAFFTYLVLSPSLALMVVAAARASTGGLPRDRGGAVRATAGGVLFAAGWVAGFVALFISTDERCRSTATTISCTSDVVTVPELAMGVALLGAGVAAAVGLARGR